MAQKPEIQYIGQFYVHGSEARALELQERKKARTSLPLKYLEKIEKIYVDPVALIGIAVAVVMLVVMVMGAMQIQTAWNEYEQMSGYLSQVKRENALLMHEYHAGYDLETIEAQALAIGMVPMDQVQTYTITVTVPQPEPEPTVWENIVWFLSGLFA